MKITVLGGDVRSLKLIDLLLLDGHDIKAYGFDENQLTNFNISKSLEQGLQDADIVIGPIPCIKNNEFLNTPLFSQKIKIKEVFENMKKNQIFIAGSIPEDIHDLGKSRKIKTYDLFSREEMAVLNAIPTAEGAIQVAMEEKDITLHGSKSIVLGFGRIGKVLSNMLRGIGANPYVEARKYTDLAWIKAYGYNPVHINELDDFLPEMDFVFNTVPHMILDKERLSKLNKNCLVVDLASAPGGVDFKIAENLGIKVVWALALPGKVAPVTAANVMKTTVYNIIDELEV